MKHIIIDKHNNIIYIHYMQVLWVASCLNIICGLAVGILNFVDGRLLTTMLKMEY